MNFTCSRERDLGVVMSLWEHSRVILFSPSGNYQRATFLTIAPDIWTKIKCTNFYFLNFLINYPPAHRLHCLHVIPFVYYHDLGFKKA